MEGIRVQREKQGITQEELARKVGATRSAIAKWETQDKYPRCKILPSLAKALNCSIDDLFS